MSLRLEQEASYFIHQHSYLATLLMNTNSEVASSQLQCVMCRMQPFHVSLCGTQRYRVQLYLVKFRGLLDLVNFY